MKKIYVFFYHIKKKKNVESINKRKKSKKNLVFHNGSKYFDRCIRGGTIHPFTTYYYLEDYYKPIKTNSAFNGNYIQYNSNGDNDKNLSLKEYLDMIKPYLSDIINDHKKWEIQLTMQINFIYFKDLRETRTMRTKSDNI